MAISVGYEVETWCTHYFLNFRKPNPIDPDILRSMKIQHNVGYAKNLGKEKRNQVPYNLNSEKTKKNKGVPESPIGRGKNTFIMMR